MFGYGNWVKLPIGVHSGALRPRMKRKIVGVVLTVLAIAFASVAGAGIAPPDPMMIVQCDPGGVIADGHEADPGHSRSLGHHHCPQVLCGAWMPCAAEVLSGPDQAIGWTVTDPRNPTGVDAVHYKPPPRA